MRHAEIQNGTHPVKYRIPIAPRFDLSTFSFYQIFRNIGMGENYLISFQYGHLKRKTLFYIHIVFVTTALFHT